jgi:hypothetical protein
VAFLSQQEADNLAQSGARSGTYSNHDIYNAFKGNVGAHFSLFQKRFIDMNAGANISLRDFDFENHIRPILEARIVNTPSIFDVEVKRDSSSDAKVDKKLTDILSDWLSQKVFGLGGDFWDAQRRWNEGLELFGDQYLKFYRPANGVLNISTMPYHVDVHVESAPWDVQDITRYVFIWSAQLSQDKTQSGSATRRINSRFTEFGPDGIKDSGSELPEVEGENGLNYIHHMRLGASTDSAFGTGGAESLMQAQMSANMLSTNLLKTIKNEALGMWVPDLTGGIGIHDFIELFNASRAEQGKMYAGAIKALPFKNVSGNPQVEPILRALERKVEHMYRVGRVRYRPENQDMRSGKAMVMADAELRTYIEEKERGLARQWEGLFAKYFVLEGLVPSVEDVVSRIEVRYPAFDSIDPEERRVFSENIAKAFADGVIGRKTYLSELVRMGIVDKELDVEAELMAAENDRAASGAMFESEDATEDAGDAKPEAGDDADDAEDEASVPPFVKKNK